MVSEYKHVFRFFAHFDGLWHIQPKELYHMSTVLKLSSGTVVELCDGKGHLAKVALKQVSRKDAHFDIITSSHHLKSDPRVSLCVASKVSLSDLSEWIPPLTQLGVDTLSWINPTPLNTSAKERLHRVAISTIKQAKTPYFMNLSTETSLADHYTHHSNSCDCFVLDPQAPLPLIHHLMHLTPATPLKSLVFYLGGSAGFNKESRQLLKDVKAGTLSPYILKVSTALISTAALCQGVLATQKLSKM
ncbi:MAG: RsmE family RNA methyltransferase [Proteobacteria bacterium]|nr:RsmE family RNA methyltransferase [Pseudomonadota bacterium]